ncbi:MAG TPA: hypothetical protein VFP47_14425 [Pyrinomonadaceae bacterium]|nr:hypothetical protein [Pyrinomonadaceae bacterium]
MKTGWRVAFLGITALAIAMELWASFDGNPYTEPWTDLIVAYIPGEIIALAIGGLATWLAVHFIKRYQQKEDK